MDCRTVPSPITTGTGPCTINAGPGSISLNGAAGAFQGNEIIAGKFYEAVYRPNTGTAVIVGQSGGGQQINPATSSQHAVQFGQLTGVLGTVRNLRASCLANATTITFTADQVVVGSAVNGLQYLLPRYNKTLNLATTGAGGLDTGTATANSWVAVYAIYNLTTATAALLGMLETTSAATSVYSGAYMPGGYTASALLAVLRVGATAGEFNACLVNGRRISAPLLLTFQTSTTTSTPTSVSLSGAVPKAAVRVRGQIVAASTANSLVGMQITSDSVSAIGAKNVSTSNTESVTGNYDIDFLTAQVRYYTATNSAGTPTFSLYVSSYEI